MDKQHLKGQVAMEFMILSGVLLFVFIIMLGIISSNMAYTNKKKVNLYGEDVLTKVQKEINLASRVLDGYSREFYLPQKLGTKNYSISIFNDEVVISTDVEDFWRKIPNVTGNIQKGTNTISKSNGVVYLN